MSEKGDTTIKVKVMKSNTNDTFRLKPIQAKPIQAKPIQAKPIQAKPDTKNNEKPRGKVAETEVRASIIGPDRAMKSTSDCSTVESVSNIESCSTKFCSALCFRAPMSVTRANTAAHIQVARGSTSNPICNQDRPAKSPIY